MLLTIGTIGSALVLCLISIRSGNSPLHVLMLLMAEVRAALMQARHGAAEGWRAAMGYRGEAVRRAKVL